MARKAYRTTEQQAAASRRYLANEEAKFKRKVTNARWNTKKFILEYATEEELKDIEHLIKLKREQKKE